MHTFKRIAALCLCLVILACAFPHSANAAASRDTSRDVTLTLSYFDGTTPLSGATFQIWLVATLNAKNDAVVTDTFSKYITPSDLSSDKWAATAKELELTVLNKNLTPTDSGTIGSQGYLVFPTGSKKLTQGIYLVVGNSMTQDSTIYTPTSLLVSVPSLVDGNWAYDLTLNPKFEEDKTDDTVDRQVVKVWKDGGNTSKRPKSITVYLLRDGAVYDEQKLTKDNKWRYEWTNLPAGYRWTVVEKEVSGYTSETVVDGSLTTITNTYDIPASTTSTTTSGKLPQTGQLWWPVPVLLCAGLFFIVIGVARRKNSDA